MRIEIADKVAAKLPNTLSGLLHLAVADAQKVARKPGYKLNMTVWHWPERKVRTKRTVCDVCMAGSVIANTLKVRRTHNTEPWDLPHALQPKIEAINSMRLGLFSTALAELHPKLPVTDEQREALDTANTVILETYRRRTDERLPLARRGRALWSSYLKAAKILEKVGL